MINRPLEILSPRIQLLYNTLRTGGMAALPEFWNEMEKHGTPIIEDDSEGYSLVTFM